MPVAAPTRAAYLAVWRDALEVVLGAKPTGCYATTIRPT